MHRTFSAAKALVFIFSAVLSFGFAAATSFGASAQAQPIGMPGDHKVEGRIVDVRSQRVLLNNGMVFLIPQDVARWSELSLGGVIRVQYEKKNGENVATSIESGEGAQGRCGN